MVVDVVIDLLPNSDVLMLRVIERRPPVQPLSVEQAKAALDEERERAE